MEFLTCDLPGPPRKHATRPSLRLLTGRGMDGRIVPYHPCIDQGPEPLIVLLWLEPTMVILRVLYCCAVMPFLQTAVNLCCYLSAFLLGSFSPPLCS